jgi:hypothetical protein
MPRRNHLTDGWSHCRTRRTATQNERRGQKRYDGVYVQAHRNVSP